MFIKEVIWKDIFADKIIEKHKVTLDELEEVLLSNPMAYKAEKGRVKGEDLFAGLGQTSGGRYLIAFFVLKKGAIALPISAREMSESERRYYHEQKKIH